MLLLKTTVLQILYYLQKKQPFSIFTYINSYKDIKLDEGTEIFGVLVRKERRENNQFSIKDNKQNSDNNNIWYEISIKNDVIPIKNIGKSKILKYGIKYDDRFSKVISDSYNKNKNFSVVDLALYTANFQNDDIITKLKEKIDIGLNQNINPISNINALKHLHIHFQRIRQAQEKKWAKDYFAEGLEFLKRGNNPYAIENLDLAKKFDKNNQKIYIAKGCALANMNNYSEGLKEIKQALRINPNNQEANQYYKTIREKLRQKQKDSDVRKKQSQGSSSRVLVKKY